MAMLELRPLWGFILGLNLCLLIWRISVQEPAMLEVEMAPGAKQQPAYGGKHLLADYQAQPQSLQQQQQQQQQQNDSGLATMPNELPAYADSDSSQMPTTSHNANYNKQSHKLTLHMRAQRNKTVASGGRGSPPLATTHTQQHTLTKDTAVRTLTTGSPAALPAIVTPAFLPADDYRQLIDLHNFAYVLPHAVCAPHINTLILVHSAPQNHAKRMLIRETWGSGSLLAGTPLQVIFLLGAVPTAEQQRNLTSEYATYGDLVQGNFNDNYRNMTYKHMMAFKWYLYSCAHAHLLIKVDDDVYVNTPQLLRYMRTPATQPANGTQPFDAAHSLYHPRTRNLLFCEENVGALVKRTFRSKWRVSFKEYSLRYYPPYCPGYVIVYTGDVVQRLYVAAQQHRYFWIDDVHITGVLAQATNTTITTSRSYVLHKDDCERLLAQAHAHANGVGKTEQNTKAYEFLFASHTITPQQIRALWHLYALQQPCNITAPADKAHESSVAATPATVTVADPS